MRKRTKKEFTDYNDYHDRPFGTKWGTAFAISELIQVVDKAKANELKVIKERPLMNRLEIDEVLQDAFLKSKKLSIQLNERDKNGSLLDPIVGFFAGMADEEHLYIDEHAIEWDNIRNIRKENR